MKKKALNLTKMYDDMGHELATTFMGYRQNGAGQVGIQAQHAWKGASA